MSTLVHTERPTVVIDQAGDSIAANLEVNDGRSIVVVSQMPGDVLSVSMEQRGTTLTLSDDASLVAAYSNIASNAATFAQDSATAAANSAAQAEVDQLIVAADRLTVEALRQATGDDREAVAFMATDVANDRDNVQTNADQVAQQTLDVTDMRDLVADLTDEVAADHALVVLLRDQVSVDAAQVTQDKADVAADRAAVQILYDETEDNALEVGVNLDAVTTLAAQVATNTTLTQSNTDQVEQHRTDVYAARVEVNTARDEVEADRVAVESAQLQVSGDAAQVATDREQVNTQHTAIMGYRDEVEADRAEVEGNLTDIQALATQVYNHNLTVQANADQVASDRTDVLNAKTAVDSAAAQVQTHLTQSTTLAAEVSNDATQVAADRVAVTNYTLDVSNNTTLVSNLALQVQNDRVSAQTAALEASESAFDVQIDRAEVETLAAQVTLDASQSQSNATAAATSEANALTYANLSEAAKDAAESAAAAASGGLKPLGNWDASGGTAPPAPTDSTVPWYRISVAGTVSGIGAVEVGDNIYWDVSSTGWFKIDNTEKFTSINGFTSGVVTLNAGHVGAIPASKEGPGNGLNADLLDGQHGTHYLDFGNATNKPSPSLTLQGDVSGTTSFLGLASTIMNVTVANDSHSHSFSTVTGLQTALDAKQPILTGAASTIASSNLTTNRALTSNGSGKVAVSAVTSTELGYLSGATSSLQTQINAKANTASLGTAAAANVTTSATDTTSGRLWRTNDLVKTTSDTDSTAGSMLRVGDFGIGSLSPPGLPGSDALAAAPSGFYTGGGGGGINFPGSTNYGPCIRLNRNSVPYNIHIWQSENPALQFWVGRVGYVQEVYHTGNLTGAVSTIATSNLTANRALTSSGSGKVGVSATTAVELAHLSGVTSAVQTQLNSKLNLLGGTLTGSVAYEADNYTTSWARGFMGQDGGVIQGGIGFLGSAGGLSSVFLGWGSSPWSSATRISISADGIGLLGPVNINSSPALTTATVTGAASTILTSNLTASRALTSDGSGKVAASTTTAAELGHLSGVTSAIQTQINSKQATITGGATTITTSNLTTNRALTSNASGKVAVSAVTATELGYLSGVTTSIKTSLNLETAAICQSVAAMKIASGPVLCSGRSMVLSDIAVMANTGAKLSTASYYADVHDGDAQYFIRTLSSYRAEIDKPAWEPDGVRDHYILNGTTYIAVLIDRIKGVKNLAQHGLSETATPEQNAAAIQSAISSGDGFSRKLVIEVPKGTYVVRGGFSWGHDIVITGQGRDLSKLSFIINTGDSAQYALQCDARNEFKNIQLELNAASTSTTAVAIRSLAPTVNNGMSQSRVENMRISGAWWRCFDTSGTTISMAYWTVFRDVELIGYTSAGIRVLAGSNVLQMDKVWFHNAGGSARDLELNAIEAVYGNNLYFQSANSSWNMHITGCQSVSMNNLNYEPMRRNFVEASPNFKVDGVLVLTQDASSSNYLFDIRPSNGTSTYVQRYEIKRTQFFNLVHDTRVAISNGTTSSTTSYEVSVTEVANRSTSYSVLPMVGLIHYRMVDNVPLMNNAADPVIECGQNSNGRYFRYASGQQVCYGAQTSLAGWGATGWKTPTTWTFPKAFGTGFPVALMYSMRVHSSDYSKLYHVLPTTDSGAQASADFQFNVATAFSIAPIFTPVAIGRWQ